MRMVDVRFSGPDLILSGRALTHLNPFNASSSCDFAPLKFPVRGNSYSLSSKCKIFFTEYIKMSFIVQIPTIPERLFAAS